MKTCFFPLQTFDTSASSGTGENDILPFSFDRAISATHIRIYPLTTVDEGDAAGEPPEMRFEINGCRGR